MKPATLTPSTAFFQAPGLALEAEQLEAMVELAIAQLQATLYPPDTWSDLTLAEVETVGCGLFCLADRVGTRVRVRRH